MVGRAGFEPATNGLKVPEADAIALWFLGAAEAIAVGTSVPRLSHCRMSRFCSVRPDLDGDGCRLTLMYLASTRERPDAAFDAAGGVRLANERRRVIDDVFAANLHTLHTSFGRAAKSGSLNGNAIYSRRTGTDAIGLKRNIIPQQRAQLTHWPVSAAAGWRR